MIDCCLTFLKLEVYAKPNVPDECPTIGRSSIFMLKKYDKFQVFSGAFS